MNRNEEHYKDVVTKREKTKFVSCGYKDRFDPFVLNNVEHVYNLYDRLFRSFLTDIPCGKLLDVGCGTGIYFRALADYAEKIEALDASRSMLDIARRYCDQTGLTHLNPTLGSTESLPYDDESFDVVIALDLLHHVQDLGKALDEIHRVLKHGGHFFVFEPNVENPLMFLAHAIPSEERLALSRNRPRKLIAFLSRRFDSVRWEGVCELITQSTGLQRFILDAYLKMWRATGLEKWFPRQAWLGRKR